MFEFLEIQITLGMVIGYLIFRVGEKLAEDGKQEPRILFLIASGALLMLIRLQLIVISL